MAHLPTLTIKNDKYHLIQLLFCFVLFVGCFFFLVSNTKITRAVICELGEN